MDWMNHDILDVFALICIYQFSLLGSGYLGSSWWKDLVLIFE